MRVDIVQEYVPRYRVPLFENMKRLAADRAIDIRIVAGSPQKTQAARKDWASDGADVHLKQKEFEILGRRLTLRQTATATRGSDLVIVEQARRNLDVYTALARGNPPVAMWGHGSDHVRQVRRADAFLMKQLTRRATWFFGYTPASVESVVSSGFERARTTVLWNTTDTAALKDSLASIEADEVEEFRAALNTTGPLVLFIGGLDPSKRLPFLLEAFELVVKRAPNAILAVLGSGPDEGWLRGESGNRPWLRVGPPVFGRDFAVSIASADALAMPGRVGLIAVDSIVAGTPIVTTAWPFHAPEFAYLDSTNSVTTPDDVNQYADALLTVIADADLRARLREGCARSAELFSIEAMARRFVDGIASAINS